MVWQDINNGDGGAEVRGKLNTGIARAHKGGYVQNITSGASPVDILTEGVGITVITSGGTDGDEICMLKRPTTSPDIGLDTDEWASVAVEQAGKRHVVILNVQTSGSDVVKVKNESHDGTFYVNDAAGNSLGFTDDQGVVLDYAGAYAYFVWNGGDWLLDAGDRDNSTSVDNSVIYFRTTGHNLFKADGSLGYAVVISGGDGSNSIGGGNASLQGGPAGDGQPGGHVEVAAGSGGLNGDGGAVTLAGGQGQGTGAGGNVEITGGFCAGTGFGGSVNIAGGPSSDGTAGSAELRGGDGGLVSGSGANARVYGGDANGAGDGGSVLIKAGGGGATSGSGGEVSVTAGNANANNDNGGNIYLQPGAKDGSGTDGLIFLSRVPVADPHLAGALWNSAGTLKISAG